MYDLRNDKPTDGLTTKVGVDTGEAPSREHLAVLRKVLKRTPMENEIPDLYKRSDFLKSFRALVVNPGDIIFEQVRNPLVTCRILSPSVEILKDTHASTLSSCPQNCATIFAIQWIGALCEDDAKVG